MPQSGAASNLFSSFAAMLSLVVWPLVLWVNGLMPRGSKLAVNYVLAMLHQVYMSAY